MAPHTTICNQPHILLQAASLFDPIAFKQAQTEQDDKVNHGYVLIIMSIEQWLLNWGVQKVY